MNGGATLLDTPTDDADLRTGVQVMGDPLPWPRAGTTIMPGGKAKKIPNYVFRPWIKFYTPAEAVERQEKIKLLWQAAGHPYFENERLVFRAEFIFARPASHYGTGRNANTIKPQFLHVRPGGTGHKNSEGHRLGGDIDNLCKLILDALNEVAYADDGQVVRIEAEKCFVDQAGATEPQTIFDLLPATSDNSAFF